jgi:glutamyl-tRNA reductase
VIQENMKSRMAAAEEAEKIIDMKVGEFMRWVKSLNAVPAIRSLRESADSIRASELKKAQRALESGEKPEVVIEQLARTLTHKIIHDPSAVLRQADHDGDTMLLEAAKRLFNIEDDNS